MAIVDLTQAEILQVHKAINDRIVLLRALPNQGLTRAQKRMDEEALANCKSALTKLYAYYGELLTARNIAKPD